MSIPPRLLALRPVCSHASFSSLIPSHSRCFSNSGKLQTRKKTARNNELRGMSAIKGTGVAPWIKLSVTTDDLQTPRKIEPYFQDTEDHGLWGFFNEKREILTDPYSQFEHGRAWTVHELRTKSFEDLHTIWWMCAREKNRLGTERITRKKLKAGYGEQEGDDRVEVVRKTQKAIKFTLTERYYAWEDALKLAREDPEIIVGTAGSVTFEPTGETLEKRRRDIGWESGKQLLDKPKERTEARETLQRRLKERYNTPTPEPKAQVVPKRIEENFGELNIDKSKFKTNLVRGLAVGGILGEFL